MRQHRTALAHPEDHPVGVGGEGEGPAEHGPGGRSSKHSQEAVDETVIEQLASITDGEGHSVLGELLNAFLTAVPERLAALDREATAGNLAAVAEQAHALTGSSASFGARGMADLCRELRTAADGGDQEAAAALVRALHAEFLRVRAWLVTFRGRP